MTAVGLAPARTYDFVWPSELGQGPLRALRTVHEAFARQMSVAFSARLHTLVDFEVGDIFQACYETFVFGCESPTALYIAGPPAGPRFAIEADPRLVVFLAARYSGGGGPVEPERRALSQIERRVGQRLAEQALLALREAWTANTALPIRGVPFPLDVRQFEADAALALTHPPEEMVVVVPVEIRVAGGSTGITVVYPLSWVETVFGPPSSRAAVRPPPKPVPEPERLRFEAAIGGTTVELRAELGRARLTLTDLLALEPGDVIPLSGRPGEPIPVLLGGEIRYRALPGRSGSRTALQILEALPASDPTPTAP